MLNVILLIAVGYCKRKTHSGKIDEIYIYYIPVCSDRYLVNKKKEILYMVVGKEQGLYRYRRFINTIALLSRTAIQGYNVLFSKHYPIINHFGSSLHLTGKKKTIPLL